MKCKDVPGPRLMLPGLLGGTGGGGPVTEGWLLREVWWGRGEVGEGVLFSLGTVGALSDACEGRGLAGTGGAAPLEAEELDETPAMEGGEKSLEFSLNSRAWK